MATESCAVAVKALDELNKSIDEQANKDRKTLAKIDTEINDIHHIIEFVNMPANKMSKVVKRLKELYKFRRELKEDLIVIQNIFTHKKDGNQELKNSNIRTAGYQREADTSYVKHFGVQ